MRAGVRAGMHVRWCTQLVCAACVRRVCVRRVCVRRVCGVCHHGAHLGGARVLDALLEAQLARLQLAISPYLPVSAYISLALALARLQLDDLDAAEQLAHQPRALVRRPQQRLLG